MSANLTHLASAWPARPTADDKPGTAEGLNKAAGGQNGGGRSPPRKRSLEVHLNRDVRLSTIGVRSMLLEPLELGARATLLPPAHAALRLGPALVHVEHLARRHTAPLARLDAD